MKDVYLNHPTLLLHVLWRGKRRIKYQIAQRGKMNFKGISYIKWINLNWKKKVSYKFISEHILVRLWSLAFGGNLPTDVAPWHCYSSHLLSGDYVHSLVAIESKIPAWIPRIVMIQQVLTTGTKPGGPGSRTRDVALQIVMHYSCTILAKILHILV